MELLCGGFLSLSRPRFPSPFDFFQHPLFLLSRLTQTLNSVSHFSERSVDASIVPAARINDPYAHRLQKRHAHASPPPKREWEKDFGQFKTAKQKPKRKLQMQKKTTHAITCYIAALRTTTHRIRFSVCFLFVNRIFFSCLFRIRFSCIYPDLFIYFLVGRYSAFVHHTPTGSKQGENMIGAWRHKCVECRKNRKKIKEANWENKTVGNRKKIPQNRIEWSVNSIWIFWIPLRGYGLICTGCSAANRFE